MARNKIRSYRGVLVLEEIRKNWIFSMPIIIGELFQLIFGIMDGPMAGRGDYGLLAAVSLANSLLILPFIFCVGITIPICQGVSVADGQNDPSAAAQYFFNGVGLSLLVAIVVAGALIAGRPLMYSLHQDRRVVILATPYLSPMALSLIPMTAFLALKQFADSVGRARITMLLSLISVPCKLLLNYVLIDGRWGAPELGLKGAGLATLLTRSLLFAALCVIICLHPAFRQYRESWKNQWMPRANILKELLLQGISCSSQLVVEISALAAAGIFIGSMGADQLAAHQIARDCSNVVLMIFLGLGQGTSIRISRLLGLRDWPVISAVARGSMYNTMAFGIACGLVFVALRRELPLFFTQERHVVTLSARLIVFAACFQLCNALQVTFAVLLRSIKDIKQPVIYVVIAYWAIGLPLGYYLGIPLRLGVNGIWLGMIIGLAAAALLLKLRFDRLTKPFLALHESGPGDHSL